MRGRVGWSGGSKAVFCAPASWGRACCNVQSCHTHDGQLHAHAPLQIMLGSAWPLEVSGAEPQAGWQPRSGPPHGRIETLLLLRHCPSTAGPLRALQRVSSAVFTLLSTARRTAAAASQGVQPTEG